MQVSTLAPNTDDTQYTYVHIGVDDGSQLAGPVIVTDEMAACQRARSICLIDTKWRPVITAVVGGRNIDPVESNSPSGSLSTHPDV